MEGGSVDEDSFTSHVQLNGNMNASLGAMNERGGDNGG